MPARHRFCLPHLFRASRVLVIPLLAAALSVAHPAYAADGLRGTSEPVAISDLASLSLEQLGNIVVTSASRRSERLSDVAATIYVISREDIRRSGARTLPQVLRLAPNLTTARADANQWAVTARGFNSVLANKMLVLVDGRTVYSPLFSGVFWEVQDVFLDDVDRIEVISGPGGTLWGTNAVNGVINIVTRSAAETAGIMAVGHLGTEADRGAARVGRKVGTGFLRAYGQYVNQPSTERPTGVSLRDASTRGQGGFRGDWSGERHGFTFQGDLYSVDIDQPGIERLDTGGNLLGRWTQQLRDGLEQRIQAYVDYSEREQPAAIHEKLTTVDVEVQRELRPHARHDLLVGGGYRAQFDRVDNLSPALAFMPADRDLQLASVYVQDQVKASNTVDVSASLKLEHNSFTGAEWMPNLRIGWRPHEGHLIWTQFARAVRAPSRIDREYFSPASPPHFIVAGGPEFRSELSDVVELGWRAQPTATITASVTGFYRHNTRLRTLELTPEGPQFFNGAAGQATGVESWFWWRPVSWARLQAGWVEQRVTLWLADGGSDLQGLSGLGNDPHRVITARAGLDVARNGELDVMVRHIGELPSPKVPAYTALDARLGWWVVPALQVAVTGENLFDARHAEWGAPAARPEFERQITVQITWRR
jgi:iron complex outermembrane receptor protein